MYTEKARELRRCTGTTKKGEPCRAWAVWDDSRQLCMAHAGRHHRGRLPQTHAPHRPTRYKPCRCVAYAHPHRPGGGLCRYPDEPLYRSTVPAGTHSFPRLPEKWKPLARLLERRYRDYRRRTTT